MSREVPTDGPPSSAPTFSFLTTAYRTESLIGATIESVLAQTNGDWELVLVDNGNSDAMAQVVGPYLNDPRIRLVRQDNAGYAGGVMAAARHARGRYVCVLDSDDHLAREFCARVGQFAAAEPSVAAIAVDAYRFVGDGTNDRDLPVPYSRSVGVSDRPDPRRSLTFGDVVGGLVPYYTAAIRADAWNAVGGYAPGVDGADESVVIWLRLTQEYDVRMLPERLARYRIRNDSISRSVESVEAFEDALVRSFRSVEPLDDPAHRRALETNLAGINAIREIRRSRRALLDGDDSVARRHARAAWRHRRSARSAALVVGMSVAPGVLRAVHPAKNRVQDAASVVLARFGVRSARRRHILVLVENLSVPMDRRVWQESRALVEAGHRVTVICPRGTTTDTARDEVIEGVRIRRYRLRAATGGPVGYLREYPTALFHTMRLAVAVRLRSRVDVVHACNPPDFLFLVGLVLRPFGSRFVYDQHDLVPELFESRFTDARSRAAAAVLRHVTRTLERLTYRCADGVIATNDSYRRTAVGRGGCDPARVTVVRSAPDLNRFTPCDPDPELRRGRRHLAAYLGVMGPQDGVDHALRALAHLHHELGRDDLHAVFMGSGDEFDALVALARELRIDHLVEFPGRVPDEFVRRCLSTADVCLSPDPRNPLNDVSTMNKVVEYMAMGRPMVSYDLMEAQVSAGDAAVYVPGNDIEAFGRGIATLLDDPERREKMGLLGRERVERELSWNNSARALLAFYDRVLADR